MAFFFLENHSLLEEEADLQLVSKSMLHYNIMQAWTDVGDKGVAG